MSVRVMAKVFANSESKLAARLVLLVLADSAHDDGISWPDQPTIAAKALVSEQTVRRSIRELEALAELEVRKAQRGRRRINVYRVTVPGLEEPAYDRLPFEVKEPFTTAHPARSSVDDRASTPPTTAHLGPISAADTSYGVNRKENRKEEPPLPPLEQPPPVVLSDGRNLALDALTEVCGIQEGSPRYVQAVVALNGRLHKTTGAVLAPGIRHLFWDECRRQAEGQADGEQRLRLVQGDPERFADLLAARIRQKAAVYRTNMPGAMLTPKALRDWWLDVAAPAAGFNPDAASRLPDV